MNSPDNVTFPENKPVGIVILRGIHGGFSVISVSEPTGRPLYASRDIADVLSWVHVVLNEEESDISIMGREQQEQRYAIKNTSEIDEEDEDEDDIPKLPDMGSVGPTLTHQPNHGCLKEGCKNKTGKGCTDLNCPYNFRRVGVNQIHTV